MQASSKSDWALPVLSNFEGHQFSSPFTEAQPLAALMLLTYSVMHAMQLNPRRSRSSILFSACIRFGRGRNAFKMLKFSGVRIFMVSRWLSSSQPSAQETIDGARVSGVSQTLSLQDDDAEHVDASLDAVYELCRAHGIIMQDWCDGKHRISSYISCGAQGHVAGMVYGCYYYSPGMFPLMYRDRQYPAFFLPMQDTDGGKVDATEPAAKAAEGVETPAMKLAEAAKAAGDEEGATAGKKKAARGKASSGTRGKGRGRGRARGRGRGRKVSCWSTTAGSLRVRTCVYVSYFQADMTSCAIVLGTEYECSGFANRLSPQIQERVFTNDTSHGTIFAPPPPPPSPPPRGIHRPLLAADMDGWNHSIQMQSASQFHPVIAHVSIFHEFVGHLGKSFLGALASERLKPADIFAKPMLG